MALGMMGRGPAPMRGRLSPEQRQQIRDVRAEQGRGAARAMRREMRQEAGLPVRPMQNEPAQMPMPVDQGFQVTPEQMEALRQQPMQRPTPEQMQNMLGAYQGVQQQPAVQDRMYRYPITDMMYRPSIHGTLGQMQQSMQPQFNANMPAMQPGMNTGINPFYNRPLGIGAGIANVLK